MTTPLFNLLLLSALPKRQPDSCVWLSDGAIDYRFVSMGTTVGLTLKDKKNTSSADGLVCNLLQKTYSFFLKQQK